MGTLQERRISRTKVGVVACEGLGGMEDRCATWLRTLSERDMATLAEMNWEWYDAAGGMVVSGVAQDWIEEHGGERRFWYCF